LEFVKLYEPREIIGESSTMSAISDCPWDPILSGGFIKFGEANEHSVNR